jgi:cytochrome c biogenesis protein CcdA
MERILGYGTAVFVCLTIMFGILLVALWQWKEIVGWILMGLLILFALLFAAWVVNELVLRHKRYQYKEEALMSSGNPKSGYPGQSFSPPHTYWQQQEAYS